MSDVVRTRGLRKRYPDGTEALRGVDLSVTSGAVVGLLGPNGAGKTTLAEILEGLRRPTGGSVSVLGMDPTDRSRALQARIGVQLQETAFPEALTVREVIRLFGAFYVDPEPVETILSRVGLEEKATSRTPTLSGGERQRLALGLALVNRPDLLILDEPTAGLDPAARRRLHALVRELSGEGRTILLTTHYVEEAESLCDRVLMLRGGRIVADGTPFELVSRARGSSLLWLSVEGPFRPEVLSGDDTSYQGREGEYHRYTTASPARAISRLGGLLENGDLALTDLRVKRPTLEDVYLETMGDGELVREGAGSAAPADRAPGEDR